MIRLIAFDVDGTLVEHPERLVIWQLLNRRFLGDLAVSDQRYFDFMDGKFDYDAWVAMDVSDWITAGAHRNEMAEEVRQLRLIPGAHEVLAGLRALGIDLDATTARLEVEGIAAFEKAFADLLSSLAAKAQHLDGAG